MGRDPRVDPRAGDVVRKGDKTRRVLEVSRRNEWEGRQVYAVRFLRSSPRGEAGASNWLDQWVAWCRGASVVRVAQEGSDGK